MLVILTSAPDRTDGMDYMAGRQAVALCNPRLPRGTPTDSPALGDELRTGGAMDCTIDTAATKQTRVRGVDDGVDRLAREVAALDLQPSGADRPHQATIAAHFTGHGQRGKGGARSGRGSPRRESYFVAPRAASLAAFATTNFSRRRAGIFISWPVWGLRPIRAL